MAWETPKTDWAANDVPGPNDFNRIEGNTLDNHERLNGHDSDIANLDSRISSNTNRLNGHMSDGTQHKKTVRFVIGTSTSGWTEKDCDYLCDGTADQVEINNAIAALPASGGEVIILDGTYNITAPIIVNKDNVSIRGNGNATVLKRMWNSSSGQGVIILTSVQGCRVENLQIDGNMTTYTSIYNYGIHLSSSSNNTITGNTCNNNNNGIRLYSSTNNAITGNTCNNNNNGIYLVTSSNNNTVTGNTCYNNDNNNGIYLSSSTNNTITGNTCNNNNNGIYLVTSSNNTITGNTCNNNNGGIVLYDSSRNTVTGNTCIRGTGTPEDYTINQYSIQLDGSDTYHNLISSNNCMGKAVATFGGGYNSVWGNKFDNTDALP